MPFLTRLSIIFVSIQILIGIVCAQSNDPKTTALEIERTLSSVELGRIDDEKVAKFLIRPEIRFNEPMELVGIGKSCACAEVRLVSATPLILALDLKASERGPDERGGYFYLTYKSVSVDGGLQRLIQPFAYSKKEDISFRKESIQINLLEGDAPHSVIFENNTGKEWLETFVTFVRDKDEGDEVKHCEFKASMGEVVKDCQAIDLNVAPVRRLFDVVAGCKSVSGELRIFARVGTREVLRLMTTKRVEFSIAPKVRVFPGLLYLDPSAELITIRILKAKTSPAFNDVSVVLGHAESEAVIESQLIIKSSHWIEVSVLAERLRPYVGKEVSIRIGCDRLIRAQLVFATICLHNI